MKLTKTNLHEIIQESLRKILNENINEISQQCAKYKEILTKEFIQAQKDVTNSKATFHNGIAPSLIAKGYTVNSNGDNWVSFLSPSRLFSFYACSFGFPWKLTEKVKMNFSNYSWEELYQYPNYTHTRTYKEFQLNDFEKLYMKLSNEIGEPVVLEPKKITSEKLEKYKKFTVCARGGRTYEEIEEFDNFEEAKQLAYKLAKQECEQGKKRWDSTRKYYCITPRDVTRQHTECAVAYEYYNCDEHQYYYSVEVN